MQAFFWPHPELGCSPLELWELSLGCASSDLIWGECAPCWFRAVQGKVEGIFGKVGSMFDKCLVLAVGISVQELLDTPELCQVSAPTVELQQFGQEY